LRGRCKMPKLVVGIPICNEELYIEKTLTSVLQNDLKDVEIFISEKGSTDRTLGIVEKTLSSFPDRLVSKVTLHSRSEVPNATHNWDYCYQNSDSKYFLWVGGHDLITSNFIDNTLKLIDENDDVSMSTGMPYGISSDPNSENISFTPHAVYRNTEQNRLKKYLHAVSSLNNCTIVHSIFRRQHLHTYQPHASCPSADHILIARALWHGRLIYDDKSKFIRRYFDSANRSTKVANYVSNLNHEMFIEEHCKDYAKLASDFYNKNVRLIDTSTHLVRSALYSRWDPSGNKAIENKKALQSLVAADKSKPSFSEQSPAQEVISQLINLYNQGQLSTLVEKAQALVEQYPTAFAVWNILGAAHKGLGTIDEASKAFKKVTEINPNYAGGYNNLGTALHDQYKFEEAIRVYEKAISIKPDYSEAFYNMGVTLKEVSRFEDAKLAFQKVITFNPRNEKAYNFLGLIFQRQCRLEDALDAYKKAVSIRPDYTEVYNNMGIALKDQGLLEEAIRAYKKASALKPDNAEAHYNIGNALKEQGKTEEAIVAYSKALTLRPDNYEAYNNLGNALMDKNKLEEAIDAFTKALTLKSDYFQAHVNLGNALRDNGKEEEALEAYHRSISIEPDYADAYFNIGLSLQRLEKFEESIDAYEKTLSLNPDHFLAYNNLGNVLRNYGKKECSIKAYEKAITLKPDYTEAISNLGVILKECDRFAEALEAFEKALKIDQTYVEAYNNIGVTLKEQGMSEKSIEAYKNALSIRPNYPEALNNMGIALKDQGRIEEALEAYTKAIALKPDYPEAHNNMSIALQDQGRLKEAIEAYTKAIALNPDYAEAYNNLGTALIDLGKREEAIEVYEKALSINADFATARSQKLHEQAHIFDWESIEADRFLFPTLGITEKFVTPFAFLSLEDDPARHLLRAQNYVKHKFPQKSAVIPARPVQRPERLRIGYFSADFHNFPGMYLMAGMLEQHDRSKFEIFAFSYGPKTNDEMQKRIIAAVDHFIDIQNMPTTAVRECALEHKLDIALHRNGHTKNGRTELFAERLAPIQINYLGYPGTLGTDFIDYIVADTIVIPEDKQKHYSEQIIYLPHTYQPNDNTRAISQKTFTRADMRLPDKSFVFCCFNKNYKISPKEFDIWMRLLGKVEGSVLWLLKSDQLAEKKLCLEAEKRGVNAERLIFADRLPQDEHLARHKLADLFLDTFNYNAHTTTSDALWAGLPIVTKLGKSFSARVAGSLLNSVGLQELITHSEAEYEELILRLSLQPETLSEIKKKLSANRLSYPLFDTQKYTKNIEQAYHLAYERYFNDQKPSTIIVPT
jgi:protein O-GlcNAc transferase